MILTFIISAIIVLALSILLALGMSSPRDGFLPLIILTILFVCILGGVASLIILSVYGVIP